MFADSDAGKSIEWHSGNLRGAGETSRDDRPELKRQLLAIVALIFPNACSISS